MKKIIRNPNAIGFLIFLFFNCTHHLVVRDVVTNWGDYDKSIYVTVIDQGTGITKPFSMKFILKTSKGDTVDTMEVPAKSYQTNGRPEIKFYQNFIPEIYNNCLRDVTSVTLIADPEDINKDILRGKKHDNIKDTIIEKQVESNWPWPYAQNIGFGVQALPSKNICPSLISLQFTIVPSPSEQNPAPLQLIRYSLFHSNDAIAFYSDYVTLSGQVPPQTIQVMPGIEYPQDNKPLRIEADLYYSGNKQIHSTTTVIPPWDDEQASQMYKYHRDGYLRRCAGN